MAQIRKGLPGDDEKFWNLATNNARSIYHELDTYWEHIDKGFEEIQVLSELRYKFVDILIKAARHAIGMREEFQSPLLAEPLLNNLNNPAVVRQEGGRIIYDLALVAGTESDLKDGIQYGRAMIRAASKGKELKTKEAKARFWKNFVYLPYKGMGDTSTLLGDIDPEGEDTGLYERTIAWRHQGWGGLTPYWIYLDRGTQSKYAYPSPRGTRFVEKATNMAQKLFDVELAKKYIETEQVIRTRLGEFLDNPEAFRPGTILVKDVTNAYYVTQTGRIGYGQQRRIREYVRRT
jgi:hypothetical protein